MTAATPRTHRITSSEAGQRKGELTGIAEGAENREVRAASPYTRSDGPLPWITVKDVLWALYLYVGRPLSGASLPNPHLILRVAEPVFQILSAPQKGEVLPKLAAAFGPETPRPILKAMARSYIANAVRQAVDDLMLARGDAHMRCLSFQGREYLDTALAGGNGVLLVAMHWHAGRAALRYLASIGYPVMSIRNGQPSDRRMGRIGRRFLQPRYVDFLHEVIRDEVFVQDRECTLKALGRLRSGGIVNIHIDAPFSRNLITVPFLGRTRRFPTGALHLARISGCSVLPMIALGCTQSLEIRIEHPLPLDRSLPAGEFCQSHLLALIRILETQVREHPDQWELWTRL